MSRNYSVKEVPPGVPSWNGIRTGRMAFFPRLSDFFDRNFICMKSSRAKSNKQVHRRADPLEPGGSIVGHTKSRAFKATVLFCANSARTDRLSQCKESSRSNSVLHAPHSVNKCHVPALRALRGPAAAPRVDWAQLRQPRRACRATTPRTASAWKLGPGQMPGRHAVGCSSSRGWEIRES